MREFLLGLLSLSLGGGAVILALLLAIRLSGQRYAARWRCLGWLLISLRLAVPLALPSALPTWTPVQLPALSDPVVLHGPVTAPRPTGSTVSPAPAAAPAPTAVARPSAHPSPGMTLFQLLALLWGAGAVGVLGWNLWRHGRFCRWARRWRKPVDDPALLETYRAIGAEMGLGRLPPLYLCTGLPAPMLVGLFRPILLLPDASPLPPCALRHELQHLRRRDIPFKALILWACALHWFNPALWLMARAADRDVELACDDAVLGSMTRAEKLDYAQAILHASQGDPKKKRSDPHDTHA